MILLLQFDCGMKERHILHRFELAGCPENGFVLPDSVHEPPYSLYALPESRTYRAFCPGFKVYKNPDDSKRSVLSIRLNRRRSCSLDVGYSYLLARYADESEARKTLEKEQARWLEAAAELVMRNSNVEPTIPAAKVDRLDSDDERKQWCAKSGTTALDIE